MKLGIFYFVATFIVFNPNGTPKAIDTDGYHFRSKRVCEDVRAKVVKWVDSDEFKTKFPDATIKYSKCDTVEINVGGVSI
mgnify:CR=1 FL=1